MAAHELTAKVSPGDGWEATQNPHGNSPARHGLAEQIVSLVAPRRYSPPSGTALHPRIEASRYEGPRRARTLERRSSQSSGTNSVALNNIARQLAFKCMI